MTPTMYPYFSYRDAAGALRFLEEAFGFTTSARWDDPDGTLQHAEVTFGDDAVMMGTADHQSATLESTTVGQGVYVYVEDVDEHFERAGRRGAGGVPAGGHREGDAPLSGARPGGLRVELW